MRLRHAIMTGLRGSLDFRGRMTRAEYLPFLLAASLAFGLVLLIGYRLLPPGKQGWVAAAVVTLFYLPMTSAGSRRLRDASKAPERMLNPVKPVAVLALIYGLFVLVPQTTWGFVIFWLSPLIAAPLVVLITALAVLITLAMTAIYVSDTGSRLLRPSALPPFPQSQAQK